MFWLIALGCLAAGIAIGFILSGRMNSSPEKLSNVEQKLIDMERSHARYKEEVSEHFSTTAELVQQMTDSYRDVYQHLATGAQELCSGEVANKLLLSSSEDSALGLSATAAYEREVQAPRDYAPKQSPDQEGALSEGFGLERQKDNDKDSL